jgi:hypothetical protein
MAAYMICFERIYSVSFEQDRGQLDPEHLLLEVKGPFHNGPSVA